MNLDTQWYLDINDIARGTEWLHGPMSAYANWAGLVALAVLLVLGWWWARYQPQAPRLVATAVVTGFAAVVAVLVNQHLISSTIDRARPCNTLAQVEVLVTCDADPSMPSDHCMIAGAFVLGMLVLHRRLGTLAAVLALLLAFGRVYVGVHYPLDALAGLVGGALVTMIALLVLRRPVTAIARGVGRTWLAPLVAAGPRAATAAGSAAGGNVPSHRLS